MNLDIFQSLAQKSVIGLLLNSQSPFWIVRWDMVGTQNFSSNPALPVRRL